MSKRKTTTTWLVYKIVGSKAQKLGAVEGDTESEALADAYREFNVTSEADKKRIILRSA